MIIFSKQNKSLFAGGLELKAVVADAHWVTKVELRQRNFLLTAIRAKYAATVMTVLLGTTAEEFELEATAHAELDSRLRHPGKIMIVTSAPQT